MSLPSNLRTPPELEQMTHEVRVSSTDAGPFQWQAGVFYSNIKRNYSQRLPTPGYDAVLDPVPHAGLLKVGAIQWIFVQQGFTDDSPYVSDLTYDLRQMAVFGEATYTLFDRLDVTAGLRWYDWEEDKTFKSGGILFEYGCAKPERDGVLQRSDAPVHGQLRRDRPRGRERAGVTGVPSGRRERSVEQGFVTRDAYDTYRGYPAVQDETLWNYEVGLKSSYEKVTLNGSLFYADIE